MTGIVATLQKGYKFITAPIIGNDKIVDDINYYILQG